jgi:phospholipid/cholesterol/gamma-HCH transport system substrate-binding protein
METRARYVLIGGITLLSLLGALGFLLWLAKVQIDRTYTQYDILFETVAGLSQASAVRYNGVDVGKVLGIALDRVDPALVRVRIEIYASTPVRVDTVATLASQGVTGVSIVALAGGDAAADRLTPISPATVAVIPSEASVVQGLMDDVPDLLAEARTLIAGLAAFSTPDNRDAVAEMLSNVAAATARLDGLAIQTETALTEAKVTLAQANETLAAAQSAFARADSVIRDDVPGIMDGLGAAAGRIGGAAEGFQDFSQTGLMQFSALATDARALVANLGALTDRIAADPGRFLLGDQTPDYRR